jgi:hypothetical protein
VTRPDDTFRLAIVGGGPSSTYVLERLAACVPHIEDVFSLEIHVFDKGGEFGSGEVHSPKQPPSSLLNRIAGQVGFAADESVDGAGPLLPRDVRPTLHEWCRARFAESGDSAFEVEPEDWPQRRVHGLALQDAFNTYVKLLAECSVPVHLHAAEVVDVEESAEGLRVLTCNPGEPSMRFQQVLLLTGHSHNTPRPSRRHDSWRSFTSVSDAVYVASAYPLERAIPDPAVSPGRSVGIEGMGLTALDVILYLTEGRGGRFTSNGSSGNLIYHRSGGEPSRIVPFGSAGLFTFARPFNAKERDVHALEHTPVFLTTRAVDALRLSVGTPVEVSPVGLRRQLDYERDIHPLVLLEMTLIYYTTLLGAEFGRFLVATAQKGYEAFLNGGARELSAEEAAAALLGPLEDCVTRALDDIARTLAEGTPSFRTEEYPWSREAALASYVSVVFGDPPTWDSRRHGHSRRVGDNRFSWARLINPIPPEECASPARYRDAIVAFMDRDHLWAAQDNLHNPCKAATDGVWRDLRQVLAYAVDFGGLTAASHRRFLQVYMRHHNRLSSGASVDVMRKVRALIVDGIVDPSVGPRPVVEPDNESGRFVVRGTATGAERHVDTIIDGRVHPFNPDSDESPLYRNLLRRGLLTKWRNPAADGADFEPGGLALDASFHPIRADGQAEKRFTVLGPPSEGVMFFQLGALRPQQNHHVVRDVIQWLNGFWADVRSYSASGTDRPQAPIARQEAELVLSRLP